jgi:hypothetical protein
MFLPPVNKKYRTKGKGRTSPPEKWGRNAFKAFHTLFGTADSMPGLYHSLVAHVKYLVPGMAGLDKNCKISKPKRENTSEKWCFC